VTQLYGFVYYFSRLVICANANLHVQSGYGYDGISKQREYIFGILFLLV